MTKEEVGDVVTKEDEGGAVGYQEEMVDLTRPEGDYHDVTRRRRNQHGAINNRLGVMTSIVILHLILNSFSDNVFILYFFSVLRGLKVDMVR